MDSIDLLHVFSIDIGTMIKIIAWENMLFGILVSVYRSAQKTGGHQGVILFYSLSKYIQSFAWIVISMSSLFNAPVSIILGNTLLFIGVFIESRVIIGIIGVRTNLVYRIQNIAFGTALLCFYFVEFQVGRNNEYVFLSHLVITILFFFPGIVCLVHAKTSRLKIVMGVLYLLFVLSAIYRNILEAFGLRFFMRDPNLDEGLFFFMFISIMFIGGTGFLLLVKEDDDQKLLEMAYLDSLTGLLNRRHFSEEALVTFARHVRSGKEMAVLFIDIDYFKKVNDTYGHKFGDEVLRNLASLMRKTVRTTDLACRWGGEEFVILLSESTVEHARMVSRRIQQGIGFSTFASHPDFSYTISIGICADIPRSGPDDTLESFIERSDRAMYRAKVLGRNRVEVFGFDSAPAMNA